MSVEIERGLPGLAGLWRKFLQDHASRISELRYSLFLFRKNRLAVVGLALILATLAVALAAGLLSIQHPFYVAVGNDLEQRWISDITQRLLPPSTAHPFGTDEFGVDWYS